MASRFDSVDTANPIEVFALVAAYNEDDHPNKCNLSAGAYRNNEGKPWVLPVVSTVEAQMVANKNLNHEYLTVAGLADFRTKAVELILGSSFNGIVENRVAGVQSLGGTGALRLAAEFLKRQLKYDCVLVSNPTWGNHKGIFRDAGYSQVKEYRYWNKETKGIDLDGMLKDLREAPKNSVVILHAVAHNPTGVDPTEEEWEKIATLLEKDRSDIFVLMDCAYQGFISGDVDVDAKTCRYFANRGFEFFIAQSFSKNFGLYNERIGNLCIVAKSAQVKTRVLSQMELIVRTMWSNPPNHGARVVAMVLNNPSLLTEWRANIKTMADRILLMRGQLHQKLKANGCPGNWDHITKQRGMFSYTGLNERQSEELVKTYHIYLMKSGRINMCGLTTSNIDYVADCICKVVSGSRDQSKM